MNYLFFRKFFVNLVIIIFMKYLWKNQGFVIIFNVNLFIISIIIVIILIIIITVIILIIIIGIIIIVIKVIITRILFIYLFLNCH